MSPPRSDPALGSSRPPPRLGTAKRPASLDPGAGGSATSDNPVRSSCSARWIADASSYAARNTPYAVCNSIFNCCRHFLPLAAVCNMGNMDGKVTREVGG
ncbi:hypothetical protein BGZ61DRAFT_450977 [Ilyonectria robusta]|uniref:uncharacterized protein n=1 Tax=Ilyonectria robusta TaxID=1079257 RepID=UPI001E8D4584|nr:uncharacterized protein BGZ61DRAFT_450977 [Ilyonectria robusta]KAH8699597.1 hypothetical protein BGZ61DRAFT_450977 [Ilyonectria robusta]